MRSPSVVVVAAALFLAVPAAAQDGGAGSRGLAESLFAEGKALMAKGKVAPACAKFAASSELDPKAIGVLLNLALCNEKLGKLATAWRQLRDVAARSRADRPDRAKLADDRVAAIEPRLSRVAVHVAAAARVPGLALSLDDAPLPEAAWDTELPVDGGAHVLVATAPERVSRTLQVTVRPERDRTSFDLDALEEVPRPPTAPVAAAPPPPPPPEQTSARRGAGLGLTVGGALVVAAGGAFGLATFVEKGRLGDTCPSPCIAGSAGAKEAGAAYGRANTFAWISNVAIPVGLVGAAIGVYVLATPSHAPAPAARLEVRSGPPVAGVGGSASIAYAF